MKNDKEISSKIQVLSEEENITDSFPLMVILCLFFVVTIFHLFLIPNAKVFAAWFAN